MSAPTLVMGHAVIVVLVLCSLVTCSVGKSDKNCTFPPVLNNIDDDDSRDHTWRFLSPDAAYDQPHKTGQWNIYDASAYVSHGNSLNDYDSADGYDLDCIENVGDDKVLVKRINVDGTDQFSCIQFVKRSVIVFQVKMAEYGTTADVAMCDEGSLKSHDMTLVHFHPATWQDLLAKVPYMSCSLDGGYIIKQWRDEEDKEGCSADVTNALRIEDDCDRGSGLHIIGESDNCPSPLEDLDIYKEPLMCIANWENGEYSYSVATDEWNNFFVCLRIPKQRGEEFEIDIFLDGLCDSTADITRSTSYRKLTLHQFVVSDLCANASPHCNVLGHTQCTGEVPNLCRETCGVCPEDKPWLKNSLPEAIQQKWLMQTAAKDTIGVTITDRAIQYPGDVSWRYFGPSMCNRTKVGHQKNAAEYTLVSTSIVGCLPRVATAMVNTFSEAVIGVEISRSSPTQLKMENNTAVWSSDMSSTCSKTNYLQDDMRLGDSFHTSSYGWRNLVREEENTRLSSCNLNEVENLVIKINSEEKCHASLELRTLKDAFDLTIERCGSNNQTSIPGGINTKVRYECMASFKAGWGSYIITRTRGATNSLVNETYLCWYINEQREGYLMPVSDCNDMTPSRISLDEKTPLAMVRFAIVSSEDPTGGVLHPTFSLTLVLLLAVVSKIAAQL